MTNKSKGLLLIAGLMICWPVLNTSQSFAGSKQDSKSKLERVSDSKRNSKSKKERGSEVISNHGDKITWPCPTKQELS